MAGKSPSVKRYVVQLEPEERERLEGMLRKGEHRAQAMTKARILLTADVSEGGEGWSDGRIIEALGTIRRRFIGRASSSSRKGSTPF